MTGCISYHNPHREENRNGLQIITEEPQIALQSTLEFDEISGGAYGHTICPDLSAK